MHFTLDGTEYRLGFRYFSKEIEKVKNIERTIALPNGGRRRLSATLTEDWTEHTVEAVLWRKAEGAPEKPRPGDTRDFHWEQVDVAAAHRSKVDNYDRIRGRVIALNRLVEKLPAELAPLTKHCYANRKALAPKPKPAQPEPPQ